MVNRYDWNGDLADDGVWVDADDYVALAARLAEREAEIAKNGRHAMRVTIAQIEARLAEAERALAEVGGPVAGIPWVVPGSWQSRHAKAIDAARAASSADASLCPYHERAAWGECPHCHAPHGEKCRPLTASLTQESDNAD
ncbi:MAG: hypothetical protein U1F09_12985 [Steroidobacteraceae bacterium]